MKDLHGQIISNNLIKSTLNNNGNPFDGASAASETGPSSPAGIAVLKPSPAAPANCALAVALLLTLATLWSISYSLVHLTVAAIPPVTASGVRALLAGILLFAVMRAYVIYSWLLRALGSIGVTSQSYLRIPIGVMFGMALFGEVLAPSTWFGLAFVVIGVVAMTLPARRAKAAPPPPA